uniref:Phosphoribosylamine--glycine ligase n=1 Tax=uncultured marine thaumarchaeote KM3_73_F02 TaxID=1456268 RepID=A0A075HM18_9ARCH|nr:phosphoribosylamine--glycine ligase (purD) [uncultured marine thaumarchaeote KM3_73_F02]
MVSIIIVGSGGREAAIEWKLRGSPHVEEIFVSPGNGGSKNNLSYAETDFNQLADFTESKKGFAIVGPEKPLADGIVDVFLERGLKIFGPTQKAAQLEASKVYSKYFMKRHGIPTADFRVFDSYQLADDYIKHKGGNVVIKADGLAAGKGVILCRNVIDASSALKNLMIYTKFGPAGSKVVIEDRLIGTEVSCFYLSDGSHIIPLSTAQDHKRIYDGNRGPNTGGMGSYSPSLFLTDRIQEEIHRIAGKTINGIANEGSPFKGVLYIGLIISDGKPYVLEYNVRLGDPEAQVILPRMKSDLYLYLEACVDGVLEEMDEIEWDDRPAVCVVMSSQGYPGNYETGKVISGIKDTDRIRDIHLFHAGTKRDEAQLTTSAGRVLGVTALDEDLMTTIEKVYAAVRLIKWDGEYHRSDVGMNAVNYL